jgi:hypothetical protein
MASLLSFSLLAPALMTLATGKPSVVLNQNAEEENDNQNNNLLEELKEKKLLISDFNIGEIIYFHIQRQDSFYYSASTLDLARTIFLPPPEQA